MLNIGYPTGGDGAELETNGGDNKKSSKLDTDEGGLGNSLCITKGDGGDDGGLNGKRSSGA